MPRRSASSTAGRPVAKPAPSRAQRVPAPAVDLPPAGQCLCSKVRELARRLTLRYDAALAAHGLTITQYMLLAQFARASAPLTSATLARRLGMDRTTLARLALPLESAGLLARAEVRDGDARARPLALTARGRARLRAAVPAWQAAQLAVAAQLGGARRAALDRAAGAALRALVADRAAEAAVQTR